MATLNFDFNKKVGKLKIMHSVNNVPIGDSVRQINQTTFPYFEMAHIPYCRSHDAAFSEAYCGEFAVDVHRIFRNFDNDVNDESSYDFEYTDKYVKAANDVGSEVFYRLGASIEHYKKNGTIPPKDYFKWAQICEHIIRHYNEGWDNGFEYNLKYWEIWNEPHCKNADGTNPCWQGTMEEFYDFFITVFKHIKSCFPNIILGGPSLCGLYDKVFHKEFFTKLKNENITLDFFSFHDYCKDPKKFLQDGEKAYDILSEYGYNDKTQIILNEWNYVRGWTGDNYINSIKTIKGLKGSSFIASVMICGQKSKIDHLMYYDSKPSVWCGMFDTTFLTPLKGYYPFYMYGDMYTNANNEMYSSSDDEMVYCLAGKYRNNSSIMISYFDDNDNAEEKDITLNILNMKKDVLKTIEYRILDDFHNNEIFRIDKTTSENIQTILRTKPYTTYYIKITY